MPPATARANGKKSSVRARIEQVFAHQKTRFGLFIRTIGLPRAEAKLTLANLAYNFDRLVFHQRRGVTGCSVRMYRSPAKTPGHQAEAAGNPATQGTETPIREPSAKTGR